jgi:hypothetical protein
MAQSEAHHSVCPFPPCRPLVWHIKGAVSMRGAASTRVRFLKSDKVCLDQELAALKAMKRNVLKLHQQQKRRSEQRTREDDDMALVVLALTMPDVTCLKEYLDQKRCLTRGQEEEESRLNRTVDRLLAMPDDDIVTLLEPTDELGAARLRRATGFVSDFGMHQWVVSMNGARGVAPRVSSAIHRRCELLRQIGRTAPATPPSLSRAASYKWCAKWRRRWGIGKGRAQPRDILDPAVAKRKA